MAQNMDDVKRIIETSGNSFHCKVLNYLKNKDWTILISPYYNDNVSGKPREIDLIAEKAFDVNQNSGEFFGTVNVKLFIECKYISNKTVFWFHNKDILKAEKLVTQTTPLKKNYNYTKEHHYLSEPKTVAKLFADKGKKSTDREIFYKALNQSLNAMVYYKNSGSIIKSRSENYDYIKATVNYPVIICNSFENLYKVEIERDDDPLNIDDNFQLEVNYAYTDQNGNNKNEYFLIDILAFDLIDSFIECIIIDTEKIGFFLKDKPSQQSYDPE